MSPSWMVVIGSVGATPFIWLGMMYFESTNRSAGKMVIFVLSFIPLLARGCLERKSAAE